MIAGRPFLSGTRTVVLQRQAYGFRNWRTRLGTHRVAVDTINATFTKAFRLNTTRMLGPGRVVAISYSSAVARFLSESGAATLSGGPYVAIIAHWKVPTVSKPPGEPPSGPVHHPIAYDSASWVGLDGYTTGNISATDMLQAGIEQYIDTSRNANYRAWYNWYSPADGKTSQTNIAGFAVKNGDEIFVWVGYAGKTGYIYLANNTTGQPFSLTLPRPPNATSMGNTVEWIMEDPDYGYSSDATVSNSLAKFTPITFTSAIACNANGNTTNPMNCDSVNIEDANKKVLAQVVLGNETVAIDYVG